MSITVLVSYGAVFLSSGIFFITEIDRLLLLVGGDGRNTYLALFAIDGFFTIDIMH